MTVSGAPLVLEATYDGTNPGAPAWAVRSGANTTCNGGTNVAGNVGGFSTPFTFNLDAGVWEFDATVNLGAGEYCFVFNPADPLVREVRLFKINPSGVITKPATNGVTVSGAPLVLEATYDGTNPGAPAWAVRSGANTTCDGGTNVAGNVGGFSTPFTFNLDAGVWEFDATVNLGAGEYCFVFNPADPLVREVRLFKINPSGAITKPATNGVTVSGAPLVLEATYDGTNPGAPAWAVRSGANTTCDGGTNVAGNVGGFSTAFTSTSTPGVGSSMRR